MSWTDGLTIGDIMPGIYKIGKGTAGSETGLGEIRNLELTPMMSKTDCKGGIMLGTETILDQVITGIGMMATFGFMQSLGDDDKGIWTSLMPGGTLSTGPTKKTMTLDADTICGTLASAYSSRWVFHWLGDGTESNLDHDIVFPNAWVHMANESIPLAGEDSLVWPCVLVALPDANKDVVVFGTDAA